MASRAASSAAAAQHPKKTVEAIEGFGSPVVALGPDDPDSLVVFMHGLGDTARGWEPVADMLAPRFPRTRFVLPTAKSQPVTLNGGYVMPSWYDIVGLSSREMERCDGLEDSRAAVEALLAREFAAHEGVSPATTVLAGFSQGGAVALWTSLQRDGSEPLAGTLCMSGYLPRPREPAVTEAGVGTPVMLLHGEADPMVRFSFAEATKRALGGLGVAAELRSYPELEHSASLEEIEDAAAFLKRVLPAAP